MARKYSLQQTPLSSIIGGDLWFGGSSGGILQLPDPEEDFGVVFREISEFFSSAELKAVHNYGLKALPEDRFLKLWRYPGTLARLSRVLRNSNSAYWLPIIRAQDGSR